MNSKQFLQIGGAVLILVGILGFIGVLGPTASQSLFGSVWWFDNIENWAHLILGVVAVAASMWLPASQQKPLTMVVGVLAVLAGLYSLVISSSFLGANLENPADTILHIVIGAWALYASTNKAAI